MSNPDREQKFESNGKTYTLVFGNKAFRLAERESGKTFAALDLASIEAMTILIWAGLQKYHPELKIEDVDEVLDDVGYVPMSEIVATAMQASFPSAAEETPEGNDKGAPARAQVGTGTTSSSKG